MHPRGIKNGYYYVEKLATDRASEVGVPVPKFLEIHETRDEKDMDFSLTSLLPGITMVNYLLKDNTNENDLLYDCGVIMAKIHEVRVDGFGSFDNKKAKRGTLMGLHKTYKDFIHTGLEENLQRLVGFNIITLKQADSFSRVFTENNFEPIDGPRLIHNDYADWIY